MFTARDPPPPVEYLDCEQTHDDVFSLKWCLPLTGEVPITNSVLEVKEFNGEWKQQHLSFNSISFTFKGNNYLFW